jgi:hypothetical protein
MNEYVFLYRTTEADRREAMGTPERAQQRMQAWMTWIKGLEASGNLKDAGRPLEVEGKVVRAHRDVVTDGPYVEAKDLVLGFTLVLARDLAHAAQLAAGCPILAGPSGSVEVRPTRSM